MKRLISFLLFFVLLFFGCSESVKYVCSDGSVVSDASLCPRPEEPKPPEIKITSEGTYTLTKGESMTFEGKEIKLLDVLYGGRTLFYVSGVATEIKATKELEIINGIEIVVQSIYYNNTNPELSSATFTIKRFIPKENEYLFFVDQPKIIEGVEVTLTGVSSSYVLVDLGEFEDMKIYPGSSKEIDGFNVTNVKAFPHGRRIEDYAILKVVRI
ncbi:MAG: hypothetical protein QXR60_04495 [Candidatus Nanoarchaeia archaeon]